jgi:Dolichyl-phosphate-mannose-protein mannosyltransferase
MIHPQQQPGVFGFARQRWPFFLLAVLISTVPRLIRLMYPQAWIEDAAYLYHGFTLISGQEPFFDGIYAHPPSLEAFLGLLYRIFGVGYRTAEWASAGVVAGSTFLVYLLCRRLVGSWIALVGAAAFSLAPLLVRYHVFEREVYTVACATLAILLAQKRESSTSYAFFAGGILGLAAAVKLSGLLYLPALLVVYLCRRQPKHALKSIFGWTVVGGGIWTYYLLLYGRPAIHQLVLLHFVKGGTGQFWFNIHNIFIPSLNYLLILGLGGLVLGHGRQAAEISRACLILIVVFGVFFTLVSGTFWAHNLIDLLLPLSIGTALGVKEIQLLFHSEHRRIFAAFVLLIPAAGLALLGAADRKHLTDGWGYISRAELAGCADFVRSHVASDVKIIAPHYIAAEARRFELVDYPELSGPYIWMLQTIKEKGYAGLSQHKQFKSWKRMVRETSTLWRPFTVEAIQERKVGAVIWDSAFPEWAYEYDMQRKLEEQVGLLSKAGYEIAYRGGPYTVWLPASQKGR